MIKNAPLSIFVTTIAVPIKNLFRSILMILVIFSGWSVSVVQAGPFPGKGDDGFWSMGKFKITINPALIPILGFSGGVFDLEGPTCVIRSDSHNQDVDPSGILGDGVFNSPCYYSPSYLNLPPSAATSDIEIGSFPFSFNSGRGGETRCIPKLLVCHWVMVRL